MSHREVEVFMTARLLVWALPMLGVWSHEVPRVRSEAAGSLLYALPDQALDGRPHRLEFVVTPGSIEPLRESAVFRVEKGAARPVVEVLALHPESLASLLEGPGRDQASIAIHLDGELVEEVTLAELSTRSRELEVREVTRVALQAAAGPSLLPAPANAWGCVHDCEEAWRARMNICERFPRPGCEEFADSRLTACLQVCGCPVAIREVQVVETYVGDNLPPQLVCLHEGGEPFTVGHYWHRRSRLFRRDHYNEVVYCDGVHRHELGSVDYRVDGCIQRDPSHPGICLPRGEAGPEARCN
jgi:hypothetical protein